MTTKQKRRLMAAVGPCASYLTRAEQLAAVERMLRISPERRRA